MINSLLISAIIGLVGSLFIIYRHVRKIHNYNKQLFVRAWRFELAMMEIYQDCPEHIQFKIRQLLENENELQD